MLKKFYYFGKKADGPYISGTVEALSEVEARQKLQRENVCIKLLEANDSSWTRFSGWTKKISEEKVLAFTRQLAILMRSGMTIVVALQLLKKQETNGVMARFISCAIDGLSSGLQLHEIFKSYPNVFDATYCQMVQAGECAGDLGVVLEHIVEFRTRILKTKHRTISALIYPLSVLIVAVAIVIFLTFYVIPHFEELLLSGQPTAQLPLITRMVMTWSKFLCEHFIALMFASISLVVAFVASLRTRLGAIFWAKFVLKIPVVGRLVLMQNLTIFLRTFALLLQHAVPFVEALSLSANILPNVALRKHFKDIAGQVDEGELLVQLFGRSSYVMPFIHGLLVVGEESGQLSPMLFHASEIVADELDCHIERLAAVLQPLVIIILAGMVGFIAVAMFLPMGSILQGSYG